MTDTATAAVEGADKIFRVPDDPVALLELQDELTQDNVNIDARIARATEQKSTNMGRLGKIQEKLGTLNVADEKVKAVVANRVSSLEATIANLKAKFSL